MRLTSSAFVDGEPLPPDCGSLPPLTEQGKNLSPPLTLEDIPDKTKSLTLIMDDPAAMEYVNEDGIKPYKKPFVHWVVYNIVPDVKWSWGDRVFGWDVAMDGEIICNIPKAIPTTIQPLTIDDWTKAKKDESMKKENRKLLGKHMQSQYNYNFAMVGVNDFGKFAYGGPAPPDVVHTYRFTLYAVDFGGEGAYARDDDRLMVLRRQSKERLFPTWTKDGIMQEMKGHTIGKEVTLKGTYPPKT